MITLFALAITMQQVAEQAVNQPQLDVMSARCKTPRKWLRHRGGGEVQFQPSLNAKFKDVDCVLQQLRQSLVPMKLGFVGNEVIPEEKR